MKTYTIGRNPDADITLTANFCSRDHAKLTITDTGKILLQDTSSNGTMVGGKKVSNQTVEVRYGDEVLFAGVEKLDWSKIDKPEERPVSIPGKPNPILPFFRKNGLIILGLLAIMTGGWWVYNKVLSAKEVEELPVAASEIYNRYQNAVAMVEVKYYVRIETKAGTMYFGIKDSEIGFNKDKTRLDPLSSEGTAFFTDSSGTLITNHHVIKPWQFSKELSVYFYSKIIPVIKRALKEKGWGEDEPRPYGELSGIYIYPNGQRFSPENRIECSILKISPDEEIDLASIQTLNRELPSGVSVISKTAIEQDERKIGVATPAHVIGFPYGDALAVNEDNELRCSSTSGSFTQEPAKKYVQYSAQTASGGSGSPVFNQYGKLVAVTYQGSTSGQSFNRGILAKYIRGVK